MRIVGFQKSGLSVWIGKVLKDVVPKEREWALLIIILFSEFGTEVRLLLFSTFAFFLFFLIPHNYIICMVTSSRVTRPWRPYLYRSRIRWHAPAASRPSTSYCHLQWASVWHMCFLSPLRPSKIALYLCFVYYYNSGHYINPLIMHINYKIMLIYDNMA